MRINARKLTYAAVKNGIENLKLRREKIKWRRRWTKMGIGFCGLLLLWSNVIVSLMHVSVKTQSGREAVFIITITAFALMTTICVITIFLMQANFNRFAMQEMQEVTEEFDDIRGAIFLLDCDENEKEELRKKLEEMKEENEWKDEEYDEI